MSEGKHTPGPWGSKVNEEGTLVAEMLAALREAALLIGNPKRDEYLDNRSWHEAKKIAAVVKKAIAKAEGR